MELNTDDRKTSSQVEANSDPTHSSHVPDATPSQAWKPGSPTSLGIAVFSLTFTTLSLSMMEWRGVTLANAFVGNCMFTAGIGKLVVAQWELALGNSFIHTVLGAFGLFNLSYGAMLIPYFGVREAFGDDVAQFNNAVGLYLIMWGVLVLFLAIAAVSVNFVFTSILIMTHICFVLLAASYFASADGYEVAGLALKKAGGAFGFVVGIQGWYALAHLMCRDTIFFFSFPLGDTSRMFSQWKHRAAK